MSRFRKISPSSNDAEITVECAPGTLTPDVLEALQRCGVNRVSLGVQSFVDPEAAAVGRLHKRATVLDDIARLRAAGIENINIDLIAGLPHQTAESWEFSLAEAIATGAPHVSVYMLEVDDDSRLGRELMAGGTRYHAHFVPDEELTADLYETACERLDGGRACDSTRSQISPGRARVATQPEVLDAPALSGFWGRCALDADQLTGQAPAKLSASLSRIRSRTMWPERPTQEPRSLARPRLRRPSSSDCV